MARHEDIGPVAGHHLAAGDTPVDTARARTAPEAIRRPRKHPRSRRAAWDWLVSRGDTPTCAALNARLAEVYAASEADRQRKQRARQTYLEAKQTAEVDGPRARAFIADYRRTHGRGPVWRELAEALGRAPDNWPQQGNVMYAMRAAGHLSYKNGVERSLDVPPAAGGGA